MKPLADTMLETISSIFQRLEQRQMSEEMQTALKPVLGLADQAISDVKQLFTGQINTLVESMKDVEAQVMAYQKVLFNLENKCFKKLTDQLALLRKEHRLLRNFCVQQLESVREPLARLPQVINSAVLGSSQGLDQRIQQLQDLKKQVIQINNSCLDELSLQIQELRGKLSNFEQRWANGRERQCLRQKSLGQTRRFNLQLRGTDRVGRSDEESLKHLKEELVQARKLAGQFRKYKF